MTPPRKYMSRIDDAGRLVIIRSDGEPLTTADKEWFDETVTYTLRNQAVMQARGYTPDKESTQPGNLHPSIEKLKQLINERGIQLRLLSSGLGRRPGALAEWLRGVTKPYHVDVYALFGILGYRQVAVPLEAMHEVMPIVEQYERAEQEELNRLSMGG